MLLNGLFFYDNGVKRYSFRKIAYDNGNTHIFFYGALKILVCHALVYLTLFAFGNRAPCPLLDHSKDNGVFFFLIGYVCAFL